jgi:hypothetical protein
MDICIYIHTTAMKIFTMAPPRSSAAGGRKLFPKRLPLSTSRGTILPSQRFRLFPATIVHSDFSRKKSVSRDMLSAERGFSSHARAFSRLGVFHYQHQVFFSYLPMVPKSVYITVAIPLTGYRLVWLRRVNFGLQVSLKWSPVILKVIR